MARHGRARRASHGGRVVSSPSGPPSAPGAPGGSGTSVGSTDPLLRLPERAASRWHRAGVGRRGERWFNAIAVTWFLLFAFGWTWTVAEASTGAGRFRTSAGAVVASALTNPEAPTAAFVTDAAMDALAPRGLSGKLRAVFELPGATLGDDAAAHAGGGDTALTVVGDAAAPPGRAPARTGIYQAAVKVRQAVRPVSGYNVVTLVPYDRLQSGRVGTYLLGSWPAPTASRRGDYSRPEGFIEVTKENQNTQISEHFRLRDFLTKNQHSVWPKYLVIRMKNIDKIEAALNELNRRGVDTRVVKVLSGFRTPSYNAGGGNTSGRATLSRHMYGDAADIFIDNDGNGNMDDLNGDGKVNIGDSRMICEAVEAVERSHPELIGGCGVYPGTSSHGPFAHIDTRGYRARWTGSGDGG